MFNLKKSANAIRMIYRTMGYSLIVPLTSLLLAMLLATTSYALEPVNSFITEAKRVGQGRLTYLFWNVYDAVLYAPNGVWEPNKPFALQLSYLRAINGKKIADRSIEEIRKQGFTDEVKLATWHTQMRKIFPDVDEGISLIGIYTATGDTVFFKNNTELGRMNDAEFSRLFFGIWLSEKTQAPELRKKLLGK